MAFKLLYLHGFRSSPKSAKAQLLAAQMYARAWEKDWACPQLNTAPFEAMANSEKILQSWLAEQMSASKITIVGSSLGGFYATWLAEKYGCRCVLLNPAITPWRDLHDYLGEHPLWHGGGTVVVKPQYIDELQQFAIDKITQPQRYLLVAATGDEIIDYRTMLAHYPGVKTKLIQGSDHGLSDFADYIEEIFSFCIDEIYCDN